MALGFRVSGFRFVLGACGFEVRRSGLGQV